ncbi:MAG: hypothetical protein RhofKO_13700 [Rhodothermales bacterium]
MSRFLAVMKTDVTVQVRNNLYQVGIAIGVLVAVALSVLTGPSSIGKAIGPVMLLMGGGSTLMYVAALVIFEKDEGTLHATIVSPVRAGEYLWSKVITLTVLATLECLLVVVGALLIVGLSGPVPWPNLPLLLLGLVTMSIGFTLLGIGLVVRYGKITDFLMPMAALTSTLQLPFLYFWGVVEHPALLMIPTSAPTMLIQGAFLPLAPWEWVYGLIYTAAILAVLAAWGYRAFQTHIVQKLG